MNIFFWASLLTFISSASLGVLVYVRGHSPMLAKKWAIFVATVAVWGVWAMFIAVEMNLSRALLLWQLAYAFSVLFIPSLFYDFVCCFLERPAKVSIRAHYLITILFILGVPSHHFLADPRWLSGGLIVPVGGWLFDLQAVWWYGLVLYSHYLLIREALNPTSLKRNQIIYFVIATSIGFSGGLWDHLDLFGFDAYPYGQCAIPLYPIIMSYAMLKHRLMDVSLVIRKTVVYTMATISLTAGYVVLLMILTKTLERWAGTPSVVTSTVAAVIIAVLFHPLRTRIQSWLDKHFPRESLNQEMLREATGRFIHEIKRPLANISMPAQLALMDLKAAAEAPETFQQRLPQLEQRLQYIVEESLRAGQKIEAIRDLSSHAAMPGHPLDLTVLVKHILNEEAQRIQTHRIRVDANEGVASYWVFGDAAQLEVALANIVKNAIDALAALPADRERRLSIRLRKKAEQIALEFENSGDPISEADLPHLFDPWFSRKTAGGMGLGLYLTKEILIRHHATIDVSSHASATTFTLLFKSTPDTGRR